jgi:hypothetical protein
MVQLLGAKTDGLGYDEACWQASYSCGSHSFNDPAVVNAKNFSHRQVVQARPLWPRFGSRA